MRFLAGENSRVVVDRDRGGAPLPHHPACGFACRAVGIVEVDAFEFPRRTA